MRIQGGVSRLRSPVALCHDADGLLPLAWLSFLPACAAILGKLCLQQNKTNIQKKVYQNDDINSLHTLCSCFFLSSIGWELSGKPKSGSQFLLCFLSERLTLWWSCLYTCECTCTYGRYSHTSPQLHSSME